ncbi:MAG: DUF2780 domain-containing protein [Campylobacterota bacterium]|nr:DUF2780 domain-containing protein [Campylobacterota bacterium]
MRKIFIAMIMTLGFLGATANAAGLTDTLMSSLGVSEKQAAGGAGSLLKYAKGNLSADDFSKVSSSIPDMSSILAAAPKAAKSADGGLGGLGGMASALGGDSLGGLASLASGFSDLGLDAGMIQKFIPTILEYVKGSGGSDVMGLLAGALK